VEIAARTQMAMMAVVSDVVISRAKGYIRKFELLEEGESADDTYRVTMRAEVLKGDIHNDLTGLKILVDYVIGNPVVAVLFDEENMSESPPFSAAEAEFSKIFTAAGYHLIDVAGLESSREQRAELTRKILAGDEDVMSRLADRSKADILIVGKASTEQYSEKYTQQAGLINANANISASVIMARTGQVIITKQTMAKSVHLSAETAGSRAITNGAHEIAQQLIYEIPTKLGESRTIKIIVRNCDFSQRKTIMTRLQKVNSITTVFPRSFTDNTAVFDVKTWAGSERIAQYIDSMEKPSLKITTVNAGEVITEIIPE
jgi:hypothetical protein